MLNNRMCLLSSISVVEQHDFSQLLVIRLADVTDSDVSKRACAAVDNNV